MAFMADAAFTALLNRELTKVFDQRELIVYVKHDPQYRLSSRRPALSSASRAIKDLQLTHC